MALTPSNMIPLGTMAPAFKLPNGANKIFDIEDVRKKNGLLVMFICNHCPFVVHLKEALSQAGAQLLSQDIGVVAINANDTDNYPDDSPAKMLEDAKQYNYLFPYLFDETQQIAKSYDAACTPDFFLFDKELKLVYRGQFDASRPGNSKPVSGADLYNAVDAMLADKAMPAEQIPSVGCNIKWKS